MQFHTNKIKILKLSSELLQTALMGEKSRGINVDYKVQKLVFKEAKVRDSCFYVT